MSALLLGNPGHDRETPIDVVIPVRAGDRNESLRWTLRTLAANVPHDRIWLIGHLPEWVTGVWFLPTSQKPGDAAKYANTTMAMRAACRHPDISDPFLWANDDMFAMKPVARLPVYHRGRVAGVDAAYRRRGINSSAWLAGMRATARLLAELGHPDPWSYEVHTPMPIFKAAMGEALGIAARRITAGVAVHKRTLYGNLAGLGGERIRDPKIMERGNGFPRDSLWLSTLPTSFDHGKVGAFIRSRFPTQCRYEATPPAPAPRRPAVVRRGRVARGRA